MTRSSSAHPVSLSMPRFTDCSIVPMGGGIESTARQNDSAPFIRLRWRLMKRRARSATTDAALTVTVRPDGEIALCAISVPSRCPAAK